MKVVFTSLSPPVGPAKVPTSFTFTRSQAIEPGLTNLGSVEEPSTRPQTVLVSRECCQIITGGRFFFGLLSGTERTAGLSVDYSYRGRNFFLFIGQQLRLFDYTKSEAKGRRLR